MKVIVDAQLPVKLKYWLRERGHDAMHTQGAILLNSKITL